MTESVLMVTQDFPPLHGGIQTYSFELASQFVRHTRWFGVLAPSVPNCKVYDQELPFRVFRVRGRSDSLPILGMPGFAHLVRKHRVTLSFHSQWSTAPMALLSKRVGLLPRYAVAAHAAEVHQAPLSGVGWAQKKYNRLRRAVFNEADTVFAVSEYTAGLVRKTGATRAHIAVVPGGVDYTRLRAVMGPGETVPQDFRARLGIVRDRPILLTVTRLVPRKGVDVVLRALPALIASVPPLAYCIVGEGPEEFRLQALVKELGLSSHVYFAGGIGPAALADAYRAAQVFVMTPREMGHSVEGFGLVYLEAGAFGLPVVGTRTGGVPDAVADSETGLLVEPDDVEGLARALVRLFSDRALAERLGASGKERVETCASSDHRFAELWRVLTRRS